MQMEELRAESQHLSESTGTIGRSKGASVASSHQQISVTVVTEFVRWNEEAISRCALFSSLVIFNSAIKYTLSNTESSCIAVLYIMGFNVKCLSTLFQLSKG